MQTIVNTDSEKKKPLPSKTKEERAIYMKANYAANREKRKAQQKDYNLANKEKIKANVKAYYDANIEEIKARKKAHYAANREEIKAKKKAHSKTPAGKKTNRISQWKSRGIKSDNWNITYERYITSICCEFCHKTYSTEYTDKHLDHNHSILDSYNIRGVLCMQCNITDVLG